MTLEVKPSGEACGATVTGIDLTTPLTPETVAEIRSAWLAHHVLAFPDQAMNDDDLERFTLYFGPFGDDPFIASIPGRDHIIAVKREADETAPVFAESWHTDWSFQKTPPAGTCLFGITIPPMGGDTLFANQHLALENMPDELRTKLEGKIAIHSARVPYAKEGVYGEADAQNRSMDIRASADALAAEHKHPIIRKHPETGREGIFGCVGYVVGFEGMSEAESMALLAELYVWQTREEFQYRHKWRENMLVMWDNRSVLHMATGGYDGHARLLHRTTIGAS
ncbi:TauD/TfdA family dioxygenase [Hyphococcus flavus]|uniref:TauD/TfdA family dioxygenase n=1 Tax=Hyphococcus flavus TaxID=1866326 RepID=A0AAE9ZCX2_9PROT|nr:TauD/TfdA family dioxygenase [Hyphococcus flavus]WDI30303.1 TauD/TfdA family dioxygenase [Hyphococcus flavus]